MPTNLHLAWLCNKKANGYKAFGIWNSPILYCRSVRLAIRHWRNNRKSLLIAHSAGNYSVNTVHEQWTNVLPAAQFCFVKRRKNTRNYQIEGNAVPRLPIIFITYQISWIFVRWRDFFWKQCFFHSWPNLLNKTKIISVNQVCIFELHRRRWTFGIANSVDVFQFHR